MKRNSVLVFFSAFLFLFLSSTLAAEPASNLVCDGCVGWRDIAGNAVTSAKIKNHSVRAADLAPGSVRTSKIRDGSINWEKLAVAMQDRIIQLEATVAAMQDMLGDSTVLKLDGYLDLDTTDPAKPTARFTGVNVQVVNGLRFTRTVNGLGNLIIGYDGLMEDGSDGSVTANHSICSDGRWQSQSDCETNGGVWALNHKSGSHNVVIGNQHRYSQQGGLIAGHGNAVNQTGGSVSGGPFNTASGAYSVVSGGWNNTASGQTSSVSGGAGNTASAEGSAVSGGTNNIASNYFSVVSGGKSNTASGDRSVVSGGYSREVQQEYDWAAGGLFQEQ